MGILDQVAVADPAAAVGYLAQNRADMLPTDVAAYEAKLVPLAKAWEGRKIGAAASVGGDYAPSIAAESAAIGADAMTALGKPTARPISDGINEAAAALGISPLDLATAISYETGGTFDPEQSGPTTQWGTHKGFIQFGEPQAAQYGVDWNDPVGSQLGADGAVVKYLIKAGVKPGMGLLDIYSAINAGSVGRNNASDANNGGAPGTVADKVAGMAGHRDKAAAVMGWVKTDGGVGMDAILDIADPVVRDAAIKEYEVRTAAAEGQRKAALTAASEAAFSGIEAGQRVDDMPLADRQTLGQEAMTSLRSYERSILSGTPIETDMKTYADLRTMAATDPTGFRGLVGDGLASYADRLSDADRKSLVELGTKADSATALAASALMSVATNQLRAIGIPADDPREAQLQSQLLRWQDGFIASTGKAPSALEVDQQVGKMLTPIVVDPSGLFNKRDGTAPFEFTPDQLATDGVSVGGEYASPELVADALAALRARGGEVTSETLIDSLRRFLAR